MRAVQVGAYGEPVRVAEVPEPSITAADDVVVRVAGAGVCRTDLHIVAGSLEEAFKQELPLTLGHENSGWVHEVGPAVEHLRVGDPVIVHPAVTCGHCPACRAGTTMHCRSWRFPGVDGWPGGYAELLRTSARSLVSLTPGTDPAPLAPHADAGLTAIHAVRRLAPFTSPEATVAVVGAGGVGQIAVQLLRILTAARVVVVEVDEAKAAKARTLGAHEVIVGPIAAAADAVLELTGGRGAEAVLDLVGEGEVPRHAFRTIAKGGVYAIVGYGGGLMIEHLDMINREMTVLGNQIGSYTDLRDLMTLVDQGRVTIDTKLLPLAEAADVLAAVEAGEVPSRAVLVP